LRDEIQNAVLEDIIIYDLTSSDDYDKELRGIELLNGNATIRNITVYNIYNSNTGLADTSAIGIGSSMDYAYNVIVEDIRIDNVTSPTIGMGIFVNGENISIENANISDISGPTRGPGIGFLTGTDSQVQNATIYDSDIGVMIDAEFISSSYFSTGLSFGNITRLQQA